MNANERNRIMVTMTAVFAVIGLVSFFLTLRNDSNTKVAPPTTVASVDTPSPAPPIKASTTTTLFEVSGSTTRTTPSIVNTKLPTSSSTVPKATPTIPPATTSPSTTMTQVSTTPTTPANGPPATFPYEVIVGDSLTSIGRRCSPEVTASEIYKLNRMTGDINKALPLPGKTINLSCQPAPRPTNP